MIRFNAQELIDCAPRPPRQAGLPNYIDLAQEQVYRVVRQFGVSGGKNQLIANNGM